MNECVINGVCREKQRLEAEALARWHRQEEEARLAAEAAAAAERWVLFSVSRCRACGSSLTLLSTE